MKNPKNTSQTILVTGCSKGLGRAMTAQFIALGDTVIGAARSSTAIAQLAEAHPAPHAFRTLDVADDSAVAAFAEEILASHGPPDLLVNNAALINRSAPLWQVPAAEFSTVVDVNIKGVANLIRHFLPAMIRRGSGTVVNFSSGWGRSTAPDVAPYCATKFAIEGLTAALAQELPPGLAAVTLNPGIIDTEMLRSCFGGSAGAYATPEQWAETAVPFIRQITPARNGSALTAP